MTVVDSEYGHSSHSFVYSVLVMPLWHHKCSERLVSCLQYAQYTSHGLPEYSCFGHLFCSMLVPTHNWLPECPLRLLFFLGMLPKFSLRPLVCFHCSFVPHIDFQGAHTLLNNCCDWLIEHFVSVQRQ